MPVFHMVDCVWVGKKKEQLSIYRDGDNFYLADGTELTYYMGDRCWGPIQ